jgi:ABC-type branched-subunit amino acid transport system ATPase component
MTAALELEGLTVHFPRFTLGPLDLALEPGRVVGLVGPNGSGKTTTLRCVAGSLYPDVPRSCGRGARLWCLGSETASPPLGAVTGKAAWARPAQG